MFFFLWHIWNLYIFKRNKTHKSDVYLSLKLNIEGYKTEVNVTNISIFLLT